MQILSYLDVVDLIQTSRVCSFLREVCDYDILWHQLYNDGKAEFVSSVYPSSVGTVEPSEKEKLTILTGYRRQQALKNSDEHVEVKSTPDHRSKQGTWKDVYFQRGNQELFLLSQSSGHL